MNNFKFTFIVTLLCAFTMMSCNNSNNNNNNKTEATAWKAEHVFFIGLDGWGSYSVDKSETPNIKSLMENGSYTLQKRAVLPSSSAVNWASMFMGAGPELHGYTEWGSQTPSRCYEKINHGGIDKGHGGKTMMEMETPFIIAGKGVKKGGEFQESMMQYDVTPTLAEIFNLKGPQVWVGRSMSQVFEKN